MSLNEYFKWLKPTGGVSVPIKKSDFDFKVTEFLPGTTIPEWYPPWVVKMIQRKGKPSADDEFDQAMEEDR